jgi:hypothetical protein
MGRLYAVLYRLGNLEIRADALPKIDRINDEARMTNDERSTNTQMIKQRSDRSALQSDFVIPSSLDIRHSSFPS